MADKGRVGRRASSKLKSLPCEGRMLLVLPRIGLASDDQLKHLAKSFPDGGSKAMQALLNLMASGVEDCITWSQESWRGDSIGSVTGKNGDKLDLLDPVPLPPTAGSTLLHTESTLEVVLSQLTISVAEIANKMAVSTDPLEEMVADVPRQICILVQRLRFTQEVDKYVRENRDLAKLAKVFRELKSNLGKKLLPKDLPEGQRATLSAVLIVLHEQLAILAQMAALKTPEDLSKLWMEQVRFYHDPNEKVFEIRNAEKTIPLGSEYSPPTLLTTTDFTHTLRWAYLNTMQSEASDDRNQLLVLTGPTGSGKTAMLQDVGQLLGMLPTLIRAREDTTPESLKRQIIAASVTSGGSLAPVILSQAQRLPEAVLSVALEVARDSEVALCLTMVAGPEATKLQEGELLAGSTMINMPESDLKVIAAGQLAAEGLEESDTLAEPLARILETLKKECTQQSHYDFGPRTLAQICTQVGAGRTKSIAEQDVVREVIQRCLLPKLVRADVQILNDLLKSNFEEGRRPSKEVCAPSSSKEGRWPTIVDNILCITKVEPDCMVLPVPPSDEEAFHASFCKELNKKGHTLVKLPKQLSDLSDEELLGTMPKTDEEVKDGLLVELLRKAMEDHPPDGGHVVWLYITTGQCKPEKWECLFELMNDSGCINLATGEQLRLNPNLRFLFVLPDAGNTPADTFSRTAIVWTDPESPEDAKA